MPNVLFPSQFITVFASLVLRYHCSSAMALSLVLSALTVIVLYNLFSKYRGLLRNLAEAKKSGFPYVITPWSVYTVFWLATYTIWHPLLKKLPAVCHGIWLE